MGALYKEAANYLIFFVRNCVSKIQTKKYSKTCLKQPLKKRSKLGFQDRLSFNAGQKYCRMLQWEHSAKLSTFIKLSFVIKIFVLSIFSGPLRQVLLSFVYSWPIQYCVREQSGSVVECLTLDLGAAGSSLRGITALWSLSKTH